MEDNRHPLKILIIEDDEDVRCVASLSLSLIGGLQVFEAEGSEQGLEIAAREKPDAILMDLATDADGSQTIRAFKSNPETADIPVIFLTTRTLSSEFYRMLSLGAAGILHKPFDPMTLASQLQDIINS